MMKGGSSDFAFDIQVYRLQKGCSAVRLHSALGNGGWFQRGIPYFLAPESSTRVRGGEAWRLIYCEMESTPLKGQLLTNNCLKIFLPPPLYSA